MIRLVFILFVWLLQACVIAIAVNAGWVEKQLSQEKAHVEAYLGNETAIYLSSETSGLYKKLFLDTHIVSGTYKRLIPDKNKPQHGMEGLAPWLFIWIEERLDAFWWLVYQGIYRLLVIVQWLPYLLALIMAAFVDGLVDRQVKISEYGYANPVRYQIARRSLIILMSVPLLYLSFPLNIHPMVIPAWVCCIALTIMVFVANAQQRL